MYRASLLASEAIFSKMSLMKEFMMDIALELIPAAHPAKKVAGGARSDAVGIFRLSLQLMHTHPPP